MRYILLLLLIAPILFIPSLKAYGQKPCARTNGTVGEISNMGFCKKGETTVHPQTNDYLGGTDKLMTGSAHVSHSIDNDHEVSLRWRAITPTGPCGAGIFADWMSFETNILKEHNNFVLGGGVSFGHIGNKGLKKFQHSLHKKLKCTYRWLTYSDQPEGYNTGISVISGYHKKTGKISLQILMEGSSEPALTEYGPAVNLNYDLPNNIKMGAEFKYRKIVNSDFYKTDYNKLRKVRFETAVGLRIGGWKPAIKYLSPYLQNDGRRQINVDLINFSF